MSGRGRGNSRGRGRGSGRRGRGHSRGRGGNAKPLGDVEDGQLKDCPKLLFTGTASTEQHYEAQMQDYNRYCATFVVLVKNGIKIASNAKIRALAVALGRNDAQLSSALLQLRSQYGLAEVVKAITLLDAGRQARTLERRLKSLELSATKVNPQKIAKLKIDINNLNKMKTPIGSASGAVCKHITRWVQGFTKDDLEFYAIHFPKDSWKKMADICHFRPKDFPPAPWFLPYCFGSEDIPDDSLVNICQNLNENNVNDLVKAHDIPFTIVKKFKESFTDETKGRIASYEPKLDTILWNFEDLQCSAVEEIIYGRLIRGDPVNLPNGKLLERLLTIAICLSNGNENYLDSLGTEDNFFTKLIEVANPRLTSIRLPLESPVVILGDASPSMGVAIRTSTIIASLLTSICSAKLVFFNTDNMDAPFLPKNVTEMLKLALMIKTTGLTNPAASLYPFYVKKEVVKTFIIVTDEEENYEVENYRFNGLFRKYHEEVYPATLVFVSFLKSQHARGQMVSQLKANGYSVKQLKLNSRCPDLNKLDDLFGQLSTTTDSFQEQLLAAEQECKEIGVIKLFEGIKGTNQFKDIES